MGLERVEVLVQGPEDVLHDESWGRDGSCVPVFETGKRKTWPGAREAIIHMNELVKMFPIKEEKEA